MKNRRKNKKLVLVLSGVVIAGTVIATMATVSLIQDGEILIYPNAPSRFTKITGDSEDASSEDSANFDYSTFSSMVEQYKNPQKTGAKNDTSTSKTDVLSDWNQLAEATTTTTTWSAPETIIPNLEECSSDEDNQLAEYQPIVTGFYGLPDDIQRIVTGWEQNYPSMNIAVGIYSLDGSSGYQYNEKMKINSACTIKAAYGNYVMQMCEERDIDIWDEYLQYQEHHYSPENDTELEVGQWYSIGELMYYMCNVSDNVPYSIFADEFPLDEFYMWNQQHGGEDDYQMWGKASVLQRRNEWMEILRFIDEDDTSYSQTLYYSLHNTPYCTALENVLSYRSLDWLHKSGWCDSPYYPACGDVAVVDNDYLIVILTEDYGSSEAHYDCVSAIGEAAENYRMNRGGKMF